MNETRLNEMYELQTIIEEQAKQMDRESCEALAKVFSKYGEAINPNGIHDLLLSILILQNYGYKTPQQIHELMYSLEKDKEVK